MTFAWTLYPRMWAELDLRMLAAAEAVAEITVEGGEVSWNLHAHPPDTPLSAYQVLAQGVAARAIVHCAPDAPGLYSYLFSNDRGDRPRPPPHRAPPHGRRPPRSRQALTGVRL